MSSPSNHPNCETEGLWSESRVMALLEGLLATASVKGWEPVWFLEHF